MKPVRYQLDISRTHLNAATFTLGNAGDSGTTSLAQPIDPGPSIKIKGKTLNLWGILYALTTFSVASVVFPFMVVLTGFCDLFGNKKVSLFEAITSTVFKLFTRGFNAAGNYRAKTNIFTARDSEILLSSEYSYIHLVTTT